MAHPDFAPGSGAAHSFDAMRGGGQHDHRDLSARLDGHGRALDGHAAVIADHEGRLAALEASGKAGDDDADDAGT